MANRTSLVIAHRLKTVVEADEILVLDQGRVVQRGRHAQLLKESGVYAALWSSLGNRDDVAPAVKPLIRTA